MMIQTAGGRQDDVGSKLTSCRYSNTTIVPRDMAPCNTLVSRDVLRSGEPHGIVVAGRVRSSSFSASGSAEATTANWIPSHGAGEAGIVTASQTASH
jgi:hypothetical protein